MRTGFAILAHERLDLAARLARHLAARGAPVAVHVDRRVPATGDFGAAEVFSTHAAEWGMMGLVEAALDAARLLVRAAPDLHHVFLASGACLPLRPVEELEAFLAARPETDFIESVPLTDAGWVQGGLSEERFTLHFPVSWKRRRRLFDRLVEMQRRLGLSRKMPAGVVPHLGSQWWCLSTRTLGALLADPRLPAWRRYFRRSWIPDESFLQSLVRTVGDPQRLVSRSLTLSRFDHDGRAHVFHDDHLDWLAQADHFFVRKVDPGAVRLIAHCLECPRAPAPEPSFAGRIDETPFAAARAERLWEPRGLQTQSRYPGGSGPMRPETARGWAMIAGGDPALLAAAALALGAALPEADVHGRLFARERAQFAGGGAFGPGNLTTDPGLRDYRPEQFLAGLIFARRDRLTVFTFVPGDTARGGRMALRDRNARLVLLDAGDGAAILAGLGHPLGDPAPERLRRIDARALRNDLARGRGPTLDGLAAAVSGAAR